MPRQHKVECPHCKKSYLHLHSHIEKVHPSEKFEDSLDALTEEAWNYIGNESDGLLEFVKKYKAMKNKLATKT